MRELRAAAPNQQACTWAEFPYAGHMDAYELARTEYWPVVAGFCSTHGLGVVKDACDGGGLAPSVMQQVCSQPLEFPLPQVQPNLSITTRLVP